MIGFLTDPVATRNMSKEDAMELVFLYDKYDFHTGIKLCDEVLSSMFYKNEQEFKERMNNLELLDRCVQVIVLSYEKSLKKTLANGMIWLETFFYDYEPECLILTADHIRKLMPIIACCNDDDDDANAFKVQKAIENRFQLDLRKIDFTSPMFPEFFIAKIQLTVARNTTLKLVNQIEISNCAQVVAGIYKAGIEEDTNHCMYYKVVGENHRIMLKKNEVGDWSIGNDNGYHDEELFMCKGSRCETLPPKTGWERIDDDSRNSGKTPSVDQHNLPIFTYYHNSPSGSTEIDI